MLRSENDHPFAHLIDLPMLVDELVRNIAMTAILNRLGIHTHQEDEFPTVIVFIVSGSVLSSQSDRVLEGLRKLLNDHSGDETVARWEGTISRLVAEEEEALKRENQHELTATLGGESPDYFTLWENRKLTAWVRSRAVTQFGGAYRRPVSRPAALVLPCGK